MAIPVRDWTAVVRHIALSRHAPTHRAAFYSLRPIGPNDSDLVAIYTERARELVELLTPLEQQGLDVEQHFAFAHAALGPIKPAPGIRFERDHRWGAWPRWFAHSCYCEEA